MEINCFDTTGKKLKGVTVSKKVFGLKPNEKLLAQAIRVYLSNQRKANAKTKTREEVRGSRRKIWRQKGTGRARHGDKYAPIFVGGGRAHGPKGDQNFSLSLNQKMKHRALLSALSVKFSRNQILAIKGLNKLEPKTKNFAQLIQSLKLNDKKVAFVLPKKEEKITRGVKNLAEGRVVLVKLLNPYQILTQDYLVFTPEAISVLNES